MPQARLEQWEHGLQFLTPEQRSAERQKRIAAYLDAGHGNCWLRDAAVAALVEDAFLHFHGERYGLLAWVVMPNHVHILIETRDGWALEKLVQSWKTWTAKRANMILARNGAFWGREFHDRYIRDAEHLAFAKSYIEENPWKAGLCPAPEKWRWSSAWEGSGN